MSNQMFLILDEGEELERFGSEVEIVQVDLKSDIDYEEASRLIQEALGSDLDGPDQMRFIQAVTDAFLRTKD